MSTQLITRPVSENVVKPNAYQGSSSISKDERVQQLMKSYQADQQVKYLHLQAEIEVLLQELQTLKRYSLQSTVAQNN
jgi:uncharacterized lipoprotein YajG